MHAPSFAFAGACVVMFSRLLMQDLRRSRFLVALRMAGVQDEFTFESQCFCAVIG
jgi:hypothetical protein